MKGYLINLDRASDRRDYMVGMLSRLVPDMVIERAMNVDIKAANWAPPTFIQPGRWKSDRWSLGPSDIEIFRSHIDCWEKISTSGEAGLVLEDDLLFSKNFPQAIEQLKSVRPRGIVRLDGVASPMILRKCVTQMTGFTLCPVGSLTASAAAYMLDPQTAAGLVANVKIERTVDDYLFDPTPQDRGAKGHDLPILQLEPIVAIQAQFGQFSDPEQVIPAYLKATKRTDTSTRKSQIYTGPRVYRLRKELLRALYRYRLTRRVKNVIVDGGRWGIADLSPDLHWY